MKRYFPYILLASMLLLISVIELNKPRPVDWKTTYSRYDKIPYGNYILYDVLDNLFPESEIETIHQPIYNQLSENYFSYKSWEDKFSNYLFVNERFRLTELDAEELMRYVGNGNNVFIAANHFVLDGLSDTLNVDTRPAYNMGFINDSDKEEDTDIVEKGSNFVHQDLKTPNGYKLGRRNLRYYFSSFDTVHTQILGVDAYENPNFIRISHGNGDFYLSCSPYMFTNYNMLHEKNAEYVEKALSHLSNHAIYWDEYYKIGRQESQTVFRYLLSNSALKWLLYMSVLSLICFIIFEAKRKQRIIPIVEPPKNTTLEFVETISNLYQYKSNPKNLSDKKIQFFYDYIRTKLYIKEIEMNDIFFKKLSIKADIPQEEIKKLFQLIRNIQIKDSIFEEELVLLNNRIDEFYDKVEQSVSN